MSANSSNVVQQYWKCEKCNVNQKLRLSVFKVKVAPWAKFWFAAARRNFYVEGKPIPFSITQNLLQFGE